MSTQDQCLLNSYTTLINIDSPSFYRYFPVSDFERKMYYLYTMTTWLAHILREHSNHAAILHRRIPSVEIFMYNEWRQNRIKLCTLICNYVTVNPGDQSSQRSSHRSQLHSINDPFYFYWYTCLNQDVTLDPMLGILQVFHNNQSLIR